VSRKDYSAVEAGRRSCLYPYRTDSAPLEARSDDRRT
jgi:hypothetical protein